MNGMPKIISQQHQIALVEHLRRDQQRHQRHNKHRQRHSSLKSVIAAVSLVAEAIQGLITWYEDISSPSHVLSIDSPAAIAAHRRYILARHLNLLETTSHVKSLR
jgi:hypothetical protein